MAGGLAIFAWVIAAVGRRAGRWPRFLMLQV